MKIFFISCLISAISLLIFSFILYNIFIYFEPPVTIDGHKYMPTRHIVKSLFFSFIFSIVIFTLIKKKLIKKESQKDEYKDVI
jgi:hypothetical protein